MNKQLDKDIEMAIKARGLMESMKQWDAEENDVTFEPIVKGQGDAKHRLVKRPLQIDTVISRIVPLIKRVFAPMAIAAMLAGVFFVPFGWMASNIGADYTSSNLAQYASYSSMKGAQDDAATFIAGAYDALSKMEYKDAAELSQKAMTMLQGTNDPFELDMLHDAEWYNVLANLSRRQLWYVIKAKKDLKRIASNPGKHQSDAKALMQKLKE